MSESIVKQIEDKNLSEKEALKTKLSEEIKRRRKAEQKLMNLKKELNSKIDIIKKLIS